MALGVLDVTAPFELLVEGKPHVAELLYTDRAIQERLGEMSVDLADHYAEAGNDVHVLTVLNGAKHIASALELGMQSERPDLEMTGESIQLASYANDASSGVVRLLSELRQPLDDLDVLIIDDVLDSGLTLQWLVGFVRTKKPRSIEVAVLFDKEVPNRDPKVLEGVPLHVGFKIPNDYIYGFGLDINGRKRNLRGVYRSMPQQLV